MARRDQTQHRPPAGWSAMVALAGLLALLTVACASSRGEGALTADELRRLAERHGLPPAAARLPYAVNDEMRAWVGQRVDAAAPPAERLDRLLHALLGDSGLEIHYSSGYTGTAAEVFRSREANCLSFTHLFVGLARDLGVDAYFLAVDDIEAFEKRGDLVLVAGHVTAGYGPPQALTILDFSLAAEVDYRRVRPVSDRTAAAMYYSNRGAELLGEGAVEEARKVLEVAAELDPELAGAWVNLGVARRRGGDPAGATAAYRSALEADPRATSAYQNLAALLRLRGEEDEAAELLALSTRAGSRNPYAYLDLGDISLRRGRLEEARRYYRRALRLYRDDAEPYAALGLWAFAAGDRTKAERWLARARAIDPASPRVRRLRDALAGGG